MLGQLTQAPKATEGSGKVLSKASKEGESFCLEIVPNAAWQQAGKVHCKYSRHSSLVDANYSLELGFPADFKSKSMNGQKQKLRKDSCSRLLRMPLPKSLPAHWIHIPLAKAQATGQSCRKLSAPIPIPPIISFCSDRIKLAWTSTANTQPTYIFNLSCLRSGSKRQCSE